MAAQDVRLTLKRLVAVDQHQGKSGYEDEFEVRRLLSY